MAQTDREWIAGRNAVREVLRAGRRRIFEILLARGSRSDPRLKEIEQSAGQSGASVRWVSRAQLDSIGRHHQGVAASVEPYPYSDLEAILGLAAKRGELPFLLILDTLQDPQNLGTLLRTAEAVGVHGVIIPQRRTASVTPAVVRASSGASEHLHIARHNLAQAAGHLKEHGAWIVGLENSTEAIPLDEARLDGGLALVVGGEAQGLRRLTRESCDYLVRIPMRGKIESLNAAVAGSLALYAAWQQRRVRGKGRSDAPFIDGPSESW